MGYRITRPAAATFGGIVVCAVTLGFILLMPALVQHIEQSVGTLSPARIEAYTATDGNAIAATIDSASLDGIHCRRHADLIKKHAESFGVNPRIVAAIMKAESNCDEEGPPSSAGALGLMQVMPEKGNAFRDPRLLKSDISYNIRCGTKIFREYFDIVAGAIGPPPRNPDDSRHLELALASYNAGPGAVQKAKWKVPNYNETKNYVPKVIRFFNQYGGGPILISGGEYGYSGTGPIPRIRHFTTLVAHKGINPRRGEAFDLRAEAWNLGEDAAQGIVVFTFVSSEWDFVGAAPAAGQSYSIDRDGNYLIVDFRQDSWPRQDPKKDLPHTFEMKLKPLAGGRLEFTTRLEVQWAGFGMVRYPERGPHDSSDEPAAAISQIIDVD